MVHVMKKTIIVISSLIVAAFFAEMTFRYIVGYPADKIDKKVLGMMKPDRKQNIWAPHSKYWDVEGGNHVYSRNNLGLTGTDVIISDSSKYVFILGSSFIEAMQVSPGKMAVSVFGDMLRNRDPDFNVINLAYSFMDPFDLYFRSIFYEKKYHPESIILIIDGPFSSWLERHPHPLDFTLPVNFGKMDNSVKTKLLLTLKRYSVLFTMCSKAWNVSTNKKQIKAGKVIGIESGREILTNDLLVCLLMYKELYGKRFTLISIINDDTINETLKNFCTEHSINFNFSKINIPQNKINQRGHLTIEGNRILGEFLYGSYIKFYKE